jgi:outer membrane receptor for ferrienterochelin and colicin
MTRSSVLIYLILFFIFLEMPQSLSQQRKITVKGIVLKSEDKMPIDGVFVQSLQSNSYSLSNQKGEFILYKQSPGEILINVSLLGRKTIQQAFFAKNDTTIIIYMEILSLSMNEVSVVAQQRKTGSSSVINRTAIKHTQPTSLADVLQLIPGQLSLNPDLSSAQQINLRQVPSNSDASRANALGTAVLLDGIPLSNNANLQNTVTILNSPPGSLPSFSSVAGRGNDLRQIPADQIETIEVIRGVPSARYGDLTSGAILVTTRAGVFKPQFTTRLNPNLIEQNAGFGIKLKGNSILSVDNDLTVSQDDPRNTLSKFTRFTSQFTWTRPWLKNNKLFTTARIALFSTIDENKQNPDDLRYQRKIFSRDRGFRFSNNGKLNTNSRIFSLLTYDFGLSYSSQDSYLQELVTRDLFPVSDATTNITQQGRYGESEYLSILNTQGKPLSVYARLEGTLFRTTASFLEKNNISNQLILGTEFRHDGNNGAGRIFDPTRPPRQNYSAGDRPRSYSDIPALKQLSYYAENKFATSLLNKEINIHTGLRLDNIQPLNPIQGKFGNVLAPRINLAVETIKNLRVKAGYGLTSKAPTLSYIYPGNRYFDLVNFNYYAANPAERLVIITTVVFDTNNENLKSYTSRKFEAGLDYEHSGFFGYITAFKELSKGAYGTNREVTALGVTKYKPLELPAGKPPVLDPIPLRVDQFYAAYDITANNRRIENTGIEFQFDTPRLTSINTSFNFTGAFIRTISYDNGNAVDANRAVFSNVIPNRIPIFKSGFGNEGERFNTSLRFDTRIPQLRFLLSGLVQTIWTNSTRNMNLSPFPIGYVDRLGNLVYLSESEAQQSQYGDLKRALNATLQNRDLAPALWLLNLRLTKEFRNKSSLAFYVNNVPGDQGRYYNTVSQTYIKRNQSLFFGAEFTISL